MTRDSKRWLAVSCGTGALALLAVGGWPGGPAGRTATADVVLSGDVGAKREAVGRALSGMRPDTSVLARGTFGGTPFEEVRVTVSLPPCGGCADGREWGTETLLAALRASRAVDRVFVRPG